MGGIKDIKFEERPKHLTPIMCEPISDMSLRENPQIGIKLSVGIKILILDSGVKWKLMEAMSNALDKVLKEEGLIK